MRMRKLFSKRCWFRKETPRQVSGNPVLTDERYILTEPQEITVWWTKSDHNSATINIAQLLLYEEPKHINKQWNIRSISNNEINLLWLGRSQEVDVGERRNYIVLCSLQIPHDEHNHDTVQTYTNTSVKNIFSLLIITMQ